MLEGAGRRPAARPWPLAVAVRLERWIGAIDRGLRRARKRRRGEPLELLVELDWRLGDEVMALPVYEALKRKDPASRISARVRNPELLAGNPYVDRVNPPCLSPDRILLLRGEVPGEPRRLTLGRRAGVRLDGLLPRVYLSQAERETPVTAELGALGRPRVAVHAGASQPCKAWGAGRWREVAAALRRQGAAIVAVGRDSADPGADLDLRGRTGLRELARVLAQVDLVVGDDSGPLHLALAVGTAAVAPFGPTDPALLYGPGQRFLPVVTGAACRFCWPARRLAYPGGVCPVPGRPCLDGIEVEAVVRAARAALDGREAEGA